jgi:hypothetical protein
VFLDYGSVAWKKFFVYVTKMQLTYVGIISLPLTILTHNVISREGLDLISIELCHLVDLLAHFWGLIFMTWCKYLLKKIILTCLAAHKSLPSHSSNSRNTVDECNVKYLTAIPTGGVNMDFKVDEIYKVFEKRSPLPLL